MSLLFWFPVNPSRWLGDPIVAGMNAAQEGAYFRLICLAWGDGLEEPSLPADDAQLAQMSRLGGKWAKAGPIVRKAFPDQRGDRLYSPWLSAVWTEQQGKHATVVAKGRAGGKKKAANGKLGSSPAKAQLELGPSNIEIELEGEKNSAPNGAESSSPPPARPLALEGARPAGVQITTDRPEHVSAAVAAFERRFVGGQS